MYERKERGVGRLLRTSSSFAAVSNLATSITRDGEEIRLNRALLGFLRYVGKIRSTCRCASIYGHVYPVHTELPGDGGVLRDGALVSDMVFMHRKVGGGGEAALTVWQNHRFLRIDFFTFIHPPKRNLQSDTPDYGPTSAFNSALSLQSRCDQVNFPVTPHC